jgi:hypothetical protein
MIWGLQESICAPLLTTTKPPITCSAMPMIPYVLVNYKLWKKKPQKCIFVNI